MKAFNIINLIVIILMLVGICLSEELLVSSSLKEIQARSMEIELLVDKKNTLKITEIVLMIDNLEDKWTKSESSLCFMVNHKNIQEIGIDRFILAQNEYINNWMVFPPFRTSLQMGMRNTACSFIG